MSVRMLKSLVTISLALVLVAVVGCASKSKVTVESTPTGQSGQVPQPPQSPDTAQAAVPVVTDIAVDTLPEKVPEKWGWIKKESINVRERPSTGSAIVTRLERGAKVKLLEKLNNWWKVELKHRDTAYIYTPLVSLEKYVDPWTNFKMGCRLVDTLLAVITGVAEDQQEGSQTARLTVADRWGDLSREQQEMIARKAFSYWRQCLKESGLKTANAAILIEDTSGQKLARVTGGNTSGAIKIDW
ncbi:MAG: SH3 domain-containing protein [candidate division Zixibacteria bacterium]|nr:SH3 domain-containing protein [candidate division Zixibacteria bacterium]